MWETLLLLLVATTYMLRTLLASFEIFFLNTLLALYHLHTKYFNPFYDRLVHINNSVYIDIIII